MPFRTADLRRFTCHSSHRPKPRQGGITVERHCLASLSGKVAEWALKGRKNRACGSKKILQFVRKNRNAVRSFLGEIRGYAKTSLIGLASGSAMRIGRPTFDVFCRIGSIPSARQLVAN